MNKIRKMVRRGGVAAALLLVFGIVSAVGLARPAAAAPSFRYIALGDSIASGHGIHPYGNGAGDVSCKRSIGTVPEVNYAYPHYVRDRLEVENQVRLNPADFHNLACSGASVQDLHQQVTSAISLMGTAGTSRESPAVVTITVGADNFHFDQATTYLNAFNAVSYDNFVKTRNQEAQTVRTNLVKEVKRMLPKSANRQFTLTGYYNPFNSQSAIVSAFPFNCDVQVHNRPPCQQVVNDTVQVLNDAIAGAVQDLSEDTSRVNFVSGDMLAQEFTGHESPRPYCGTADPAFGDSYVQALDVPSSIDLFNVPRDGDDCFHPNQLGHEVIGNLVISLLPFGS
jgi:lysophospholipase L1-like esterase